MSPSLSPAPRLEKASRARPSVWPGYAAALVVVAAAYLVHYLPFAPFRIAGEFGVRRPVSPAIIAILLGALARNVLRLPHFILEGCKGIVRKVIPVTIVLTGFSLNLTSIEKVGAPALAIILVSHRCRHRLRLLVRPHAQTLEANGAVDRRRNSHLRKQRHRSRGAAH